MAWHVQGAGALAVATFALPALGFAIGSAVFERPPDALGGGRPAGRLPGRHVHPAHHDDGAGIGEVGKTTVYVRAHNVEIDGDKDQTSRTPTRAAPTSSRCRRAACTSAARCASSPRPSASSARATAASTRSPARSPAARRCGRSTASTCASERPAGDRPALLGQLRVRALPALPRSGAAARRRRPVPLPRPLLDAADGLNAEAAAPTDPEALNPRPKRARRDRDGPAARAGQGSRDPRRRLDRRAHLALRGAAVGDVPQGPEGDELVLHARLGDAVRVPVAGRHRRVPGDVLRAVGHRRVRVHAPHHQRGLPRRVRARDAQVGLDHDGHPHLPAHGARVLLRRVQVPARDELDHRLRAAGPHVRDVADRLPAAVRPALLLGDDRGRQHHRVRPDRRPVSRRLPPRRGGVRRHDAVALLLDPHAARARPDRRADRRSHLPRDQARHHGAAVAEGRAGREARRGRGVR